MSVNHCVAVGKKKIYLYLGPMEDVTKTELSSLPHDTPPHTFYNHSLFLDESSLLRADESQRCTVFAYASLSLPGVVLSAVH